MNKLIKKFSTSLEKNISFAVQNIIWKIIKNKKVVGGGPAGLYCTKKLLKLFDNIKVKSK